MELSHADHVQAQQLCQMYVNLMDMSESLDPLMFKAKADHYAKTYQSFDKATKFLGGGEVCYLINRHYGEKYGVVC